MPKNDFQPSEFTKIQVGTKCPLMPDAKCFLPSFLLGRHCRSSYCARSALANKSKSNKMFV